MDNEKFFELATKNLSNEATEREREELNTYLNDENYAKQYSYLKSNWEELKLPEEYTHFDIKKGLNKLHAKINEYTVPEPIYLQKKNFREIIWSSNLLRIAASFIFLVLISTVILYFNSNFDKKETSSVFNEKVTKLGQKSILTLLDGTTITLNAGSKLKVPKDFNGNEREVYLEGEAYFEVAYEKSAPFIIHSGCFNVTVLGTVFDVKSFPGEDEYSVSLIKGKVSITGKESGVENVEIILQPDQQFLYSKTTQKHVIGDFDYLQVTGWRNNNLIFNDTPLEQVFIQLERAYGVKFRLEDKSSFKLKITANFKDTSFWTIVKVIKAATDLEYSTVSNENNELSEIIFYRN